MGTSQPGMGRDGSWSWDTWRDDEEEEKRKRGEKGEQERLHPDVDGGIWDVKQGIEVVSL